ncbi:MAG: hypothetical protein R2788_21585 [Saprospiraceae bacterium]
MASTTARLGPNLSLSRTLDLTKPTALTIFKRGGRQTTSLKFHVGDGTVYTFRSVDKDPTKALNYILNTIAAPVVQDFYSPLPNTPLRGDGRSAVVGRNRHFARNPNVVPLAGRC